MEISVEWSELSERQLRDIFDYYSITAGSRVARRIVNRILERVSVLETNPLIGQKEELLIEYTEDFRYIIEGNYKIIYWRNGNFITIASVYDCRQNPEKIKNL